MLSSSPSEGTPAVGSYGCTPQSLPKFQHPSHELLKENGFTQHVYHKYRRRCLNGRDTALRGGTGCPCSAVLGTGTWQGWTQAGSYRTALLAAAVSPRFVGSVGCAQGVQCWGWVSSQCHRALLHMSP